MQEANLIQEIKRYIPSTLKKMIRETFPAKVVAPIKGNSCEEQELDRIRKIPRYKLETTTLVNGRFRFVDSASFLFMYDEIFKKNIYSFNSAVTEPYIIDCGANIGLSIIYFKSLFPKASILAFEPDPKVYQVLRNNTSDLTDVKVIKKALWHEETTMEFFTEGADGGSLSLIPNKIETIEISTERLSAYVDRQVDFLKIDIEGAELNVLAECENKLHFVKNIFIEYHSFVDKKQELGVLISILERNNFRYHINSPGLSSGQPFIYRSTYNGMDMQLNIYAFKE